ncbi:hypothetical protein EEL33_17875 [Muribaculaceae bacterium Isolate-037 (Harlan)]|jgi:lysozyme family protein|uniref:Uncharacterized protein n=1 Tax=Lepagella muris TaxID=3032870 RepID=A0AC61RFM0_9BACT|nr:hypothetical protein EEL33_17875 [Muribaculaceae bacterium Isolate-037 (Harlan)]TGY78580.1 hypothetical protein E5331_09685 [Lepagella muris]THG52034.1 hypothetical protein E5984_08965 [Bacteroidales bacterium]TKC54929.1 hypothetical protein E5359_016245 [Bacteroidales bacterium]
MARGVDVISRKKDMANFERMIPLIMHFAAGVYGDEGKDLSLPYDEQFRLARIKGWSDDKDDPGGETMIDVTLTTYKSWCRQNGRREPSPSDLRNISYGDWRDVLKRMFWDRCRGDEIESQGLANLIVDWIWGSGAARIKDVQWIAGVKTDGIVGKDTLRALNGGIPEELFSKIYIARVCHYRKSKVAWKYMKGWLRRLEAIRPDGTFLIYGRRIVPFS